jgi:flavorubredoxin
MSPLLPQVVRAPRELVPGIWWLGGCTAAPFADRILHGYSSPFLVQGDEAALLVEAGHPAELWAVEQQLDMIKGLGGPPLKYVFATHQEPPHSSGAGRILRANPEAVLVGTVQDYHLVFPGLEDRFRPMQIGESIDLGGTQFQIVDAVIRDLASTQWGFDTRRHVLFPGDGFAYSHYHEAGQCQRTAEEVPELDIADQAALFAELALYWTRFTDIEPYIERLEAMLAELEVELIAPAHGCPITDIAATVPKIVEGLRMGSVLPDLSPPH